MAVTPQRLETFATEYTAAWNSGSPDAVAGHYAEDGSITINGGEPWTGRKGVAEMAAGFFADVPDLTLACDGVRLAGVHAVYLWTFTGTYAKSGRPLRVAGWEEWDLGDDHLVMSSRGWFDGDEYARQAEGE